jgi:small subunit ribosomal protein S17
MSRRVLQGVVLSAKDKTVKVKVERKFKHPLYKKIVKSTQKYTAHDEDNSVKVGNLVKIIETRPISKTKRWEVLSSAN